MYSNLIAKACNLVVDFHMRGGARLAGKIISADEVFAEVRVKINKQTGEFARDKQEYATVDENTYTEDRILVNIHDISIIA